MDAAEGQSAEPDRETVEEYRRLLASLLEREPERQREPVVV
jgi:hypothetical protein